MLDTVKETNQLCIPAGKGDIHVQFLRAEKCPNLKKKKKVEIIPTANLCI